jgi:hypothetical protein
VCRWVTETRQPPLHCLKFTASSQTVSNSPCRNVRFASGMQSCMSILPMTVLLFVSVRCGFDYSTTSWAVRVSRPSPLRSDFVQFDSTCGFPGEGPQTSEVSTPQGNTSHAWIPDSWYACECEQRLVSPPPGPASAAGEFCPSSWGKWVPSPRKSAVLIKKAARSPPPDIGSCNDTEMDLEAEVVRRLAESESGSSDEEEDKSDDRGGD